MINKYNFINRISIKNVEDQMKAVDHNNKKIMITIKCFSKF